MKIILLFLILWTFLMSVLGAQTIIPSDPKNPGKCIFEGKELAKGKNNFSDKCILAYCGESGSTTIESCSPVVLAGCTAGDFVDVSVEFPQCCKRYFHCKDDKGNEVVKEFSPFSE